MRYAPQKPDKLVEMHILMREKDGKNKKYDAEFKNIGYNG